MLISSIIVFACWIAFFIYWTISAIGVKKNVSGSRSWESSALLRIVFAVLVIIILNTSLFSGFWVGAENLAIFHNVIAQVIGVILCVAGIGLAIWARRYLGRNWSGYPTMKVDHELVTSGPYRYVRHPIYTGMLTALLGSSLVVGPAWLIAFIIFCVVFVWRIRVEERYMMKLFPDQYPAYKARTKALIPFVW